VIRTSRLIADSIDPSGVNVFELLKYRPTQKQLEYHSANEDEIAMAGGRGSGKTVALVMGGIRDCVQHPGLRALLIRRSYPQLRATVVAELARVGFCKRLGCRWNASELELRFANGSLLKLGYVDALSDTAQYQGTSWGLLMIDELGLLAAEALPILRETLRSGGGGQNVIGFRCTANPGGPSHSFVKSFFIDATDDGRKVITDEQGRTRRFIRSNVYDNVQHVGRRYVKVLEGIEDPARRKAMLNGDFSAFFGQVFQEWDSARHIVGPRKDVHIPPEWRKFVGIDYGMSAPWAVLWAAVDQDGRMWAYRECYERGLSPSQQARRIIEAESNAGETGVIHWIDPSTQAKVHAAAPSIMEMYWAEGLPCIPADNERLSGWQTLHSYLSESPICQFHSALKERDEWRGETCPRFHVVEGTCPNLVRTLPSLPFDPIRVEDVDTKADDHIADATRYLCAGVGGGLRPGMHVPWATDNDEPRRLTVQELGGPEPLPLIGGKFAGNLRQGLADAGVDFSRDDDAPPPGSTQPSPFK